MRGHHLTNRSDILHPHIAQLINRFPALKRCADDIADAFELLERCYRTGGKVLICGNGGSAADAEHWAAELLKGFYKKRPLGDTLAEHLTPDLAQNLQGALPTIPLSGFTSLSTAFANDNNIEYLFSQLVLGLGKKGDLLICISTSGQSRNVLFAAQTASALGMSVLGLTGRDGGTLADLTDVAIRVPETEVHLIQEYHLPVYHVLSLMLEEAFFGDDE